MPTYAYVCPSCGHEFHKFHKMNARVRPRCPQCGTVAQRKITGGAGLHFKGSGFYITDYKKAPASGDAKADKPEGKKADPKKADPEPKKGPDS